MSACTNEKLVDVVYADGKPVSRRMLAYRLMNLNCPCHPKPVDLGVPVEHLDQDPVRFPLKAEVQATLKYETDTRPLWARSACGPIQAVLDKATYTRPVGPDFVLAAVEQMTDTQRRRLAELLFPRSPYLHTACTDGPPVPDGPLTYADITEMARKVMAPTHATHPLGSFIPPDL